MKGKYSLTATTGEIFPEKSVWHKGKSIMHKIGLKIKDPIDINSVTNTSYSTKFYEPSSEELDIMLNFTNPSVGGDMNLTVIGGASNISNVDQNSWISGYWLDNIQPFNITINQENVFIDKGKVKCHLPTGLKCGPPWKIASKMFLTSVYLTGIFYLTVSSHDIRGTLFTCPKYSKFFFFIYIFLLSNSKIHNQKLGFTVEL